MPMIDPALVPVKTGSIYPEPYAAQMRDRSSLRLGDAGGLTQFGTRARDDAAHYPDIDLHHARKDGLRGFSQKDGTPYPGWPKGVKNA